MFKKTVNNFAICAGCGGIVPSVHVERDGKVYLQKNCPKCGNTEILVSSNAERFKRKRDMCGYEKEAEATCTLKCTSCDHGKVPSLVFLDVTNRCNMNCPICLANIPAMGFKFDPTMEYFEKVFKKLSEIEPRPKVQLFGGEPTVRNDLIDIIKLAKSYGISARVVTNGIKLADEEYCKKLLETRAQLMFSFDGRDPSIYKRMRKNPKTFDLKMKALENVRKHHKSKVTIMCTAGMGINDQYIDDLIAFCHENRDFIAALDLIPLVAHWGPEEVDAVSSTIEDVENMLEKARVNAKFFPAGLLLKLHTLKEVFNVRLTFGGAHPNCESVSMLISDGQQYNPLSRYLKREQDDVILEAVKLDANIGKLLKKSILVKLMGNLGNKIICSWEIFKFARRNLNFTEIFGEHPNRNIAKMLFAFVAGQKTKVLLRKYTKCQGVLRLIVLPFEEKECVESARLVECPASFAYEHPLTGDIRFMPVCAWPIYKNEILRETAKKYNITNGTEKDAEIPLTEQVSQA